MSDKDRKDAVVGAGKLGSILENFDVDAFDEVWDSVQISPNPGKSRPMHSDDKAAFVVEGFSLDVDVSAEFSQAMAEGKIRVEDGEIPAFFDERLGSHETAITSNAGTLEISESMSMDSDIAEIAEVLSVKTGQEDGGDLLELSDVEVAATEVLLADTDRRSEDSEWNSDLGAFSLELKEEDTLTQNVGVGDASGEDDWEDVGEAFGVLGAKADESVDGSTGSKVEDVDVEAVDGGKAEIIDVDDSAKVGLSLRARLGRVYPEGEIVQSEHNVNRDQYYSPALCKSVSDPQQREHGRKRVLIVMIGCIIILGIVLTAAIVIHKFMSKRGLPVDFVQKYAFQLANQSWDVIAASESGRWAAMCSDSRGVVVHDSNVVAEFLPVASGCRALSIDDEGSTIWYLDENKRLYHLSPGEEFGFESHEGPELTEIVGTQFSVSGRRVAYLAEVSGAREWRSLGLDENNRSAVSLPEDALVCEGSTPDRLAYVSEISMHLVTSKAGEMRGSRTASLDAPKLACPRALAIQCALGSDGEWAVLCRDSVIQGKDTEVMPPVRHAFTRLAAGAEQASLICHEDGTEVLTAESWLRISKSGKHETVALSTRLDDHSHFLWRKIKSVPLIGLSAGSLSQISLEGTVSAQAVIDHRQLLGTAFVGDGSHAVVVIDADSANPAGSRLALWDLSAAEIVESQVIDGFVTSINVSERGNYGFVLSDLEGKTLLTWVQWQTANHLGELEFSGDITNAAWSVDEHHVWLSYSDGHKDLFVRDDSGIRLLRSYSKDVSLGFQQKDYMWVVSPNHVELERLSDGRLSVVNAKLSKAIVGVKIDGVTTAGNSDFVLFWGGAGLWSYDTRRDAVEKLATQPVTWARLDRAGEVLATNLGIVNLFSKLEHAHAYGETQDALFWTGDGLYLQTASGDTFFRVGTEERLKRHPRSRGLKYIGSNSGVHPVSNLTLSLRGDLISLEDVLPEMTKIRAAFGGVDVHSWCWMAPNGEAQGRGSSCVAINQSSEKLETILDNNQNVTESMRALKLQRIVADYNPAELAFNESANISITTDPDGAWLIFASSEGELPKALVSENVLEKAPFTTRLERDERWFAIVVSLPGYVSRTVIFQPIYEIFERHIRLLPEAYEGMDVRVYFDAKPESPEREVELSSDFEVALKIAFGKEKEAIYSCLATGLTEDALVFKLSATCDFEFSGFRDTECGDDIVSDLSDTFNCASNPELSAARGALIRVKY